MKKYIPVLLIAAIVIPLVGFTPASTSKLSRQLRKYVRTLPGEFDQIPEERKATIREIGDYLVEEQSHDRPISMLFICTHNSRRSQMGQLWMEAAARYYGVEGISASSGGTEGTAFNPRAVAALKRAGFDFTANPSETGNNPQYLVKMGRNIPGIITYSKKYGDPFNPQTDFVAIMVCSEADQSCPLVDGADARFSLPYDDPRYFDDTPSETMKYDERCRQIAREIFFLMEYVKGQHILLVEGNR